MTPENIRAKKIAAARLAQAKNYSGIPTVVCLCGSTKFFPEYVQANYDFTMKGKIVLSVGFFHHAKDDAHGQTVGITDAEKGTLDELHKRKIDLADEVYVINKDGYIGSSTRSEIEYARMLGKPITYMQPQLLSDIDRVTDAQPQVLEEIRKEAGAEPCYICLEIGYHSTKEHNVNTDIVPVRPYSQMYERLVEEQGLLADVIADQPEGIFNAPEWQNTTIVSRTVACIKRLKALAGTVWKGAEGCETFLQRSDKLFSINQPGIDNVESLQDAVEKLKGGDQS